MVGDRFYVVSTASVQDGSSFVTTSAWAREDDKQAGMAAPQVTGSSSSYARKYALSGLLGLDDEKDADDTNDHGKKSESKSVTSDKDVKTSGGSQMTTNAHWKAIEELAKKKGVQKPFVKFVTEFEIEMLRLNKLPDAK